MRKLHTINLVEEKRSDREELTFIERGNGTFILKQWVDGECEDRIFLSKDDIEKMFNLTK